MQRITAIALAGSAALSAAVLASTAATTTATAANRAAPSATLAWKGLDADRVGTVYDAKPDGEKDGHFVLRIDPGGTQRTIVNLDLTDGGSGHWDTTPQGSYAVLAVYDGAARLNPADEAVKLAVSGPKTLDLWAGDYGLFGSTAGYTVEITFSDGTRVRSGHPGQAAPASAGAGGGAGATTTPAPARRPVGAGPDTAQQVPDFWLVLTASVITKNTLGLGQDLALTVGPRNNQVLTVQVLERATGCLVEGVNVVLIDPSGKQVTASNLRTREGLAYMGGLHLSQPGTYHVWAYATNAAGDVVMQSYLPVQVKDRHGQPFQTINGRPFTYSGGEWVEGVRRTQTAAVPAARGDLAGLVNGFLSIVNGIAQSILGPSAKRTAATASATLSNAKADATVRLQNTQSKAGTVPGVLVKGPAAPAAVPGRATATTVKLIGQDGASLIGQDGASLIGQDGASLVGTGNGIVAAGAGNIVAAGAGNIVAQGGGNLISQDGAGIVSTDGSSLVGRAKQSAGAAARARAAARAAAAAAGPRVGVCMGGYKTVGAGKTVLVDGSPVLARADGKLIPNQIVIGGRNAMPVNGPAR